MRESETFWDFSLRTYRAAGVADACLTLQNTYGLDVNLILYCCWVGGSRGRLKETPLIAALSFSASWAARVVRPLRESRTWMKTTGCTDPNVPTAACMALREKLKAVELESEHLQQTVLEALAGTSTGQVSSAIEKISATVDNLHAYLAHEGLDQNEEIASQLAAIVTAATGGASYDAVLSILLSSPTGECQD